MAHFELMECVLFMKEEGENIMKVYYLLSKEKRRIELTRTDIHALLFLNEQGVLSQPQFHEFYCLLKPMALEAFRRKMNRWSKANIVNKRKEKMVNGYEIAIIELTIAGQTILKKLGYLKEDENLKYQARSNLDHTLAIKQSIIEFLKNASLVDPFYIADGGKYIIPFGEDADNYQFDKPILIFKKQNFGIDLIPPFEKITKYNQEWIDKSKNTGVLQSLIPQDFPTANEIGLTPDWVFKIKDTFFYIEVDSGSEKIKTKRDHSNAILDKRDVKSIEGKLYRYDELAKSDITHKHKVLFALIDDSEAVITTGIHSNKDTRIANLKHEIAYMDQYQDWEVDVYVTGMKRFNALVEALYIELFDNEKEDVVTQYKNLFVSLVKFGLKPTWTNTKFSLVRDYNSRSINTSNLNYIPDVIFRFFQEGGNQYEQYFVPLFVREGNVKDMEILAYYTIPVEKGIFKYNAKILAIYQTKEELENDILRKTKKISSNKLTKEKVDNNGMDTDYIVFVAADELSDGVLRIYNADKEIIEPSQLF